MQRTVSSLGEHALIERITARLANPAWVVVGPGDDAAVIEPERGSLDVLTTDAQVEGIHFDRKFVPDAAIGHRALAVNLSDVAAMGARPRAALLSLALPDSLGIDALDRMLDGFCAVAAQHRVALVGGNITRSPGPIVIDVTVIGAVRRRRILRRSGAQPGHELFVTGFVGDAAAGLQMLRECADAAGPCVERFLRPLPRVKAGLVLSGNRVASSCIDLSDGLADGVRQLARASGCGIALDADAIPVSDAAREWAGVRGADAVEAALKGGDDYELLFTVSPRHAGRLRGARRTLGDLPITKIGRVVAGTEVTIGGRQVPAGYEHFRQDRAGED